MKCFLKKLFIFIIVSLVLLVAYGCWFFAFEPINYFGLKKETQLTYDPVWKMKHFLKFPSENIILGNSQVAHIDTDILESFSQKRFENIAFGGASLKESIDQFWWATEKTVLKEVWFCISFYTLNQFYNVDRSQSLRKMTSNPFTYMTDSYYISLALQNMLNTPKASAAVTVSQEEQTDGKYRQDLIDYAGTILHTCSTPPYQFNTRILTRLEEVGRYCNENNIRLVFIIPPIHESIYEYVIAPLDLEYAIRETRDRLAAIGKVYDLQFINDFTSDQNNFQDGFHLVEAAPTLKYIRTLSEGKENEIMRIVN